MPNPMFVLLFAVSAVACLVGVSMDAPVFVLVTKPLPVLALLGWVATSASAPTRSEPWVYRAVLAALVFSMAGDVILELDKRYFVFGLGSFLVAHLFYLLAFVAPRKGRELKLLAALPFAAWGVGMAVFVWPGLTEKGMAVPVVVYIAVLTTMMWRAAARADDAPTPAQWACIAGAIIFGLSDSLIALRDFNAPFEWSKFGILVTYWAGQFGLSLAFVYRDDAETKGNQRD